MKTLWGRQAVAAKRELEISDHRDDAAFRTAKSRKLKHFRSSSEYAGMTDSERMEKEKIIIRELEKKRDEKKRMHEMAYIQKVEQGDFDVRDEKMSGDMDRTKMDLSDDQLKLPDDVMVLDNSDEEGGWVTDESTEDVLEDLTKIHAKYQSKFLTQIEKLEAEAKAREAELAGFLM